MKTSLSLSAGLAILALTIGANVASADQLRLYSSTYSNGGNGGAYTADILSGPLNNSSYVAGLTGVGGFDFETFCMEPTEHFSSGGLYDYTLGGAVLGGSQEKAGRNATPGDQLSLGTTWLYSQYAQGLLNPALYGNNVTDRKAANRQLQLAFWYLEDEYGSLGVYAEESPGAYANEFLGLVIAQFGTLSAGQDDAADGAYGVWAINITQNGYNKQSQLYYSRVPETGTTVGMLGLALILIAGLRRRFASRV